MTTDYSLLHRSTGQHQRVVLWGAGTGAIHLLEDIFLRQQVCAIVDIDPPKWGSTFLNVCVVPPKELLKICPDQIVIAVSDVVECLRTIDQLGISRTIVEVPPKSALSPDSFLDIDTQSEALLWLKAFTSDASQVGLTPMVEFGSLLGLVRSQRLIPWDNDLDVSFDLDLRHLVLGFLNKWAFHDKARMSVSDKDPSVMVRPIQREATFFIDISFRTYDITGTSQLAHADFGAVPTAYLKPTSPIPQVDGLLGPKYPNEYLETIYGPKWRVPDRAFSFADYMPRLGGGP